MKDKLVGEDLVVKIGSVKPNTWNPKEGIEENATNRKNFENIKKEIDKKGLFEAITVRETGKGSYEILDGYHRWRACSELGFSLIRINNLGKISDRLAKAITLIKEQKKVELSQIMVADIVANLAKETNDLEELQELLGYDSEELTDYLKMSEFDWDKEMETGDKTDKEKKTTVCPKCGEVIEIS